MMLDRSIPFFNAIMRCDAYDLTRIVLPDACQIAPYRPGDETAWANMENAVGDFASVEEAKQYFCDTYCAHGRREDILFLKRTSGQVMGSCIAWTDHREEVPVHSLHWLIVDEAYQGKGYGRLLCTATMHRFDEKGGGPVYIHTQPWSWKAILLYQSLGFRLQKTVAFGSYVNQYDDVIQTLRGILSDEQMDAILRSTDP